jgi:hypothetical protein
LAQAYNPPTLGDFRMKRALLSLLLLTACGTPQEQCISSVTRDIRVVDRLIAETEANLARGYAYEEVTVYLPQWVACYRPHHHPPVEVEDPEATPPSPQLCLENVPQTTRRAVAIDLMAEQAKLNGLQAKRKQQASAAAPAIAQCKADNPE